MLRSQVKRTCGPRKRLLYPRFWWQVVIIGTAQPLNLHSMRPCRAHHSAPQPKPPMSHTRQTTLLSVQHRTTHGFRPHASHVPSSTCTSQKFEPRGARQVRIEHGGQRHNPLPLLHTTPGTARWDTCTCIMHKSGAKVHNALVSSRVAWAAGKLRQLLGSSWTVDYTDTSHYQTNMLTARTQVTTNELLASTALHFQVLPHKCAKTPA